MCYINNFEVNCNHIDYIELHIYLKQLSLNLIFNRKTKPLSSSNLVNSNIKKVKCRKKDKERPMVTYWILLLHIKKFTIIIGVVTKLPPFSKTCMGSKPGKILFVVPHLRCFFFFFDVFLSFLWRSVIFKMHIIPFVYQNLCFSSHSA